MIGDDFSIIKIGNINTAVEPGNQPIMDLKAYPNPFSERIGIEFSTSATMEVRITLTDAAGKTSRELYQAELSAGPHSFTLDAAKMGLAPGAYIYQVQAGEQVVTKSISYIKK